MSGLGLLEKLLDGAEVEWKPLEEIIDSLKTGLNPRKNFQLNTPDAEGYYVTVREIQGGKLSFSEQTDRVNQQALKMISNRSNVEAGDILFSGVGTVGRVVLIKASPENWNIKEGVYAIKPSKEKVQPAYLTYLLNSQGIVAEYQKKVVGSPVVSLPMKELRKLLFPIPCPDDPAKSLAIQGQIVRILDTFTELAAELTAELAARKKQYNHFRDRLLAFQDGDVEWKALGSVTKIKTGQSVDKMMIAENPGDYPVINSGREPLGFLNNWNTEDDPIGITSRGAGVGSVTWQEGRYYRGNLNYSVTINSDAELNVHYLYHVLEQFQSEIKALCTFDGIPALNAVNLKKLKIPVPALAEQDGIATILDKFDTLTNSLSEGLPREIALRQQQYEYYRDLLLSFPQPQEIVEA